MLVAASVAKVEPVAVALAVEPAPVEVSPVVGAPPVEAATGWVPGMIAPVAVALVTAV